MVGIIGGTGFRPQEVEGEARVVETKYGRAWAQYARLGGARVVFVPRHGPGHLVPPHRINYRANIAALRTAGVKAILATAAVGGLRAELKPGTLVVVDQFLDFTKGREETFFDGGGGKVVHTDMTWPYCRRLRKVLLEAGGRAGLSLLDGGTYVCAEGPRFESAAEIEMFASLGGDVIGMTGVPEVVLAREAGICYAAVAVVTNPGAGLTGERLAHGEVNAMMQGKRADLLRLFQEAIGEAEVERCDCSGGPG
jgi:5'-methylthioadenosine phosphorylase